MRNQEMKINREWLVVKIILKFISYLPLVLVSGDAGFLFKGGGKPRPLTGSDEPTAGGPGAAAYQAGSEL